MTAFLILERVCRMVAVGLWASVIPHRRSSQTDIFEVSWTYGSMWGVCWWLVISWKQPLLLFLACDKNMLLFVCCLFRVQTNFDYMCCFGAIRFSPTIVWMNAPYLSSIRSVVHWASARTHVLNNTCSLSHTHALYMFCVSIKAWVMTNVRYPSQLTQKLEIIIRAYLWPVQE